MGGCITLSYTYDYEPTLECGVTLYTNKNDTERRIDFETIDNYILNKFKTHPFYYKHLIPWINGLNIDAKYFNYYNTSAPGIEVSKPNPEFKLLKFEQEKEDKS